MQYQQRIRDLRDDADKTRTEVAQVIKTTQSYYAQYKNGKREMPFSRAIELAKYYNVSLDYLAGLTDTPKTLDGTPYRINKKI